jgi:hypothetical protein
MVKRGTTRSKKKELMVEEPKPKKMPQTSLSRELIDPSTGDMIYLEPYDQYPEGFRYFAKLMYISGNLSMPGIASKLNMPVETVRTWSKRDNWTLLKREVTRLANKEMVKASRRSMSNYMKDIDRGLNDMLKTLQDRCGEVDKKIDSEAAIFRYTLEIWKVKLAIFRTLTYGVQGKAFTPHPGNLIFDGMAEKTPSHALTNTPVEDIMDDIPSYLKESAKFILGMSVDDLDPAVIDAVAIHIDDESDTDADFDLILEDE